MASRTTGPIVREGSHAPVEEDPEVLLEALELAELSLPVIPLGPRSKVPRIKRWQDKATCDPRTIRRWFQDRPDDNLGLRTGGGLVVLDVDAAAGGFESYSRLTERWGQLPVTAQAETGSGGLHLLLRIDRPVGNRTGIDPGLDIRGDGGQIVVAPSVHPKTGDRYVWVRHPRDGIAAAPEWFVRWLAEGGTAGRPPRAAKTTPRTVTSIRMHGETEPASATNARADASPKTVRRNRSGDRATLAARMIARFPVADFGTRHDQMTRAVGHLVGQGYELGLIDAIMGDWSAYHHNLGVVRTEPDEAAHELAACIGSTLRALERGTFQPATSDLDHEARCREIALDAGQRELLASGIIVTDGRGQKTLIPVPRPGGKCPEPGQGNHCKRVTQIGRRLCESDDERAFVEALVVQTTHKIVSGAYANDGVIRMTHDQLRQIAGERHEGLRWAPQQIERLKRKYVTRESDGKPALRFELVREVRKGSRKRGRIHGYPSEYQPTGILNLITLPVVSARPGSDERSVLPKAKGQGRAL